MKNESLDRWRIVLAATALLSGVAAVSVYFYTRSADMMRDKVREELRAIAIAAAVHIDGDAIDGIRGAKSLNDPFFRDVVRMLNEVRDSAPDIRYAYIVRKTDDPNVVEFVADADALSTDEELDLNRNGVVDPDEEGSHPGDLYDISDIPALQGPAFVSAVTDEEFTVDQWGTLMSGYAPIKRADGTVAAVFAIDMKADVFLRSTRGIFSPVALLLVIFAGMCASALLYTVSEHHQVRMMQKMNFERSGLLRLTFHQLGEPLTIMKWSLETLREQTTNPELQKLVTEHVSCMDEGLGRLNSIIDTLQMAEKVDLGTLDWVPTPASLHDAIDNAVNEWEASARKRGIKLHVAFEKDATMPIDKPLLMLVLRQLLVNAIEYSDDGSEIVIRVRQIGHMMEIAIHDHGCGIPHDEMQHLFEKYRRASNAHLKKPDGNGLGLYIARGIVEKAGGTMRVESALGKGTTVRFTLPL